MKKMMCNFFKPIILAASFVLLAAFSSLSNSESIAEAKPNWIVSPERNGFISVVGYAPKQANVNAESQWRIALTKARQQLSMTVRVRVENSIGIEQQVHNNKETSTTDSSTRLTSNAAMNLSNAEVSTQWIDPANGALYLLLELPEDLLNR